MNIIAIGPREQDFENTNGFFSGSITLYGSGRGNNTSYCSKKGIRINHNVFSQEQADFVNLEMQRRIDEDPSVRFMSYDPNQAFDCDEALRRHALCLNSQELMERLNHKMSFRKWASSLCRTLHSDILLGAQCTYSQLTERYGPNEAFVIQMDNACGGEGTFVLQDNNSAELFGLIQPQERYLVSPYVRNNVPVNIHGIIFSQDILLLPASIQIIRLENNKLLYHGADYIAVEQLNSSAMDDFLHAAMILCRELQREGYRGVTGIDGMLVGEEALILEMNNRFQGSTALLNLALHDAGYPSMQELNYNAFTYERAGISLEGVSVPYSCYTYMADQNGKRPIGHTQVFEQDPDVVCVRSDGLRYDQPIAPMASLERVIFRTNIVSVTSEGGIALHPNIPDLEPKWVHEIVDCKNPLYLKIALLNQGISLSAEAEAFLASKGGIREGVYNAVDITLGDMIINSAVQVKFARLSPFSLDYCEGGLRVCCCGWEVSAAQISPADPLLNQTLPSGASVRDVCLLATDRVRIQHSGGCRFVRKGLGCKFCEVNEQEHPFTAEDVFHAVDLYLNSTHPFRHFLIGGRSDSADREPNEILEIVRFIRSKGDWPIYVMCVPPENLFVLDSFYAAGVTELAMNLELWDSSLAKFWMPGKGSISRKRYLQALEHATELWGKKGAVRSAFVVGLEPEQTLLEGVEAVCKIGAVPILSVFRPIPGTFGDRVVPPDNNSLLSIYRKADAICKQSGLALGPSCVPCQNNTLSMPAWFDK